jgi:hypothetical protein
MGRPTPGMTTKTRRWISWMGTTTTGLPGPRGLGYAAVVAGGVKEG